MTVYFYTQLSLTKGFETEYNTGQFDAMGPMAKRNGEVPPKQIEIVFDKGIYQRPGSATKVNGKPLDWFHLPSKPFAGTSDPSTSNKTGTNIADTDKNTITAERETNIAMWLEKTN